MKKTNETQNTQSIQAIMIELAEYNDLMVELKDQISYLEDQVKAYLTAAGTDEVLTDAGKCTWRETIANRFDSTKFKKDLPDMYKIYCKVTKYKRFTFNR